MTTTIANAIIKSQTQLYPTKLVVELTEEDSIEEYSTEVILPQLKRFIRRGMELSLDDVGTGVNYFQQIVDFLPYSSEIKFALQNFNQQFRDPKIQQKIHFWRAVSAEYKLRMILEGIEDNVDNQLSEKLDIRYKQGYYYGKPQLLQLPGDQFSPQG